MPVKKLALALFIATIITVYFVGGGEKWPRPEINSGEWIPPNLQTAIK